MNCFSVEINIFPSEGHDFCRSYSAEERKGKVGKGEA